MRVFDFTLLSGYEFSGVDVAQGFRARLFAKNNVNAKFIFTELPTIRDMELYGSQKIKRSQIMSAHLFYDRKGRYEFVCEKRSSFRK